MTFTTTARRASGLDTDNGRQLHIVLHTRLARNGRDTLAIVRTEDPNEKSFLAMLPRFAGHLKDQIKEGTIVLLTKLDNLNLPAIVEVMGVMPMPISLAGMEEEIEWPSPEEQESYIKIRPTLETMMGQLLRILSQLD